MKFYDYLKLILIDLKGRKFTSFLTLFAISLGIMSIFTIVIISNGFQHSIQKQFESLGTNKIIISLKGSNIVARQIVKGLTDNDVNLIKSKPYIKEVYPMMMRYASFKYGNEFLASSLLNGIPFDNDFYKDFNFRIDQGRLPNKNEKYAIIIGSEFAKNKFKNDVIIGGNIYIKDTKFKVVGILKSFGNPDDDSNVYINKEAFKKIFDTKDNIDMIITIVKNGYNIDLASDNLKRVLEKKHGDDSINILTFDQFFESMQKVLLIVKLALGGIGVISLLVGAVGIINTMFVIVSERTKEIGIMKSLGAKNRDILLLFVLQSGIFGLMGGLVGIIFGAIFSLVFERWAILHGYSFLTVSISYTSVFLFMLFSFIIGLIAGFIPSYKASKIIIVETFRR